MKSVNLSLLQNGNYIMSIGVYIEAAFVTMETTNFGVQKWIFEWDFWGFS